MKCVQTKYFALFAKPIFGILCNKKIRFALKNTACILAVLFTVTANTTSAFSDVSADDPNRPIYQHLQDVNIMSPLPSGNFSPDTLISKSQALVFALRAGGISIPADFDTTTLPRDIDPNQWYAAAIARAQTLKIISKKEFFVPNSAVTKAEFLAFTFRAAQIRTYRQWNDKDLIAKDVPADAWFAPDFWYAKKYHIAHTNQENNYVPFDSVNRQQAAIILYRHLRIWHGDESVKLFALLQGEMQTFMTKLKANEEEAAMIHLQEIRKLSRKIATVKNDKNAIAAKHLSKSFDNLVLSLRSFRYGKKLRALEYINLSIKYADKAANKSDTIKPIADEMQKIIAETLFESDVN
jgi:hypothetical protein